MPELGGVHHLPKCLPFPTSLPLNFVGVSINTRKHQTALPFGVGPVWLVFCSSSYLAGRTSIYLLVRVGACRALTEHPLLRPAVTCARYVVYVVPNALT